LLAQKPQQNSARSRQPHGGLRRCPAAAVGEREEAPEHRSDCLPSSEQPPSSKLQFRMLLQHFWRLESNLPEKSISVLRTLKDLRRKSSCI